MKKILISLILLFCLPVVTQGSSYREKILYLGRAETISTHGLERISIDKPEIVDVLSVGENFITLTAKQKGETIFSWWDKFGKHSIQIRVYFEDMNRVKEHIEELAAEMGLKGIRAKAMDREGKVLLLGEVKEVVDKERFLLALGELQGKVTDLIKVREDESTIEIEVKILEMKEGATKRLGVDWSFGNSDGDIVFTEPMAARAWGTLAQAPDAVFRLSEWTRSAFTATLMFLVKEGEAEILSQPKLLCRSGKEAKLLIGGEKPTFTASVSESLSTGSVEYKEYGIILNINPRVGENERIHLNLGVEVSELETVETTDYGQAYPLTKRTVQTELSLNDGETLIIGGLIKQKTEEDLEKVPWLADIPVLGKFFQNTVTTEGGGASTRGNSELVVTLTPRMVFRDRGAKETAVETSLPLESRSISQESKDYYKKGSVPDKYRDYVASIQKKIAENISYPSLFANAGWEAGLMLSLRISSKGDLEESRIIRSSNYKIFDDTALKTVKSLLYPPFPPEIGLKEINVEVPIVYKIKK